jgi:hypothetical protein
VKCYTFFFSGNCEAITVQPEDIPVCGGRIEEGNPEAVWGLLRLCQRHIRDLEII